MSIIAVMALFPSPLPLYHLLINQSVSGYDAGQEMERQREGTKAREAHRVCGAPGILQQRLMGNFCAPGAVRVTRFHKQGAGSVNKFRHSAGTESHHGSATGPVYNQTSWDQKY